MCKGLQGEVEELSIPVSGPDIADAVALRDRLDAKIAEAVGAFDAASLWDLDSATSMTAWLRHRAGMTSRDAARTASRARRLRDLPVVASTWQAGELSGGQVHAIAAAVKPNTRALFAHHEAAVVPSLVGLSVRDTAKAMGAWAAHAEAVVDDGDPAEPGRALHLSKTLDGSWAVDGTLDPEGGSVVATALRLAESADSPAEPGRTPAQRRADSLSDVCRFFLAHQRQQPGGRHRPHLNVVIDWEDLHARRPGRVVDGPQLDGAAMQALVCDSALHRVVMAGRSAVLDYGTATRMIPATLWNALVIRDEHCRFPGCDQPAAWCEGHHVVPWAESGPTALSNLVLCCARHHHRLHQPGWHAKRMPDAALELTDPNGRQWATAPPRAGPNLGYATTSSTATEMPGKA